MIGTIDEGTFDRRTAGDVQAMIARMLTVQGPPGAVDRTNGVAAASLVKRFRRMEGFLGGIILVDPETSSVRTTGFWEDDAAVRASSKYAEEMGANLADTMFGSAGSYELETFQVVALDPPPAVPFPEL